MSLETTEGIEEIQEDVAEKVEALDKKLKIHLPKKQQSYSIISSRQSSLNVAAALNGLGTDNDVPKGAKKAKNDKHLGTFSTNKEKIKNDGKKKKKIKALQRKVAANKKLNDISDKNANGNDDYDEDYGSGPDVSEIELTKQKVDITTEDDKDDNLDYPKTKPDHKKKIKRGTKKSGKRRKKSKMLISSDPAASELERLLAEKDKLLRAELAKLDPTKAPSKPDSSFYPPPKNLEKRRCYFHRGAKALKCTVCAGVHYRTKRTFKSNLRILAKINMTFLNVLNDMRGKMTTIDGNLVQVKRNLDYLEEMYDTIFRKVNRLFVDVNL